MTKEVTDQYRESDIISSHTLDNESQYQCCVERKRLYSYEELPRYLRDNNWVITGYRAYYSYPESWRSLFEKHNETFNVWSHIVGALIIIYLIIYSWVAPIHPLITTEERLILTAFLLLQMYTMATSSLYHLHLCVDEKAFRFWGCMDFSGISASIGSCSLTVSYFLLHCESGMRVFWLCALIFPNMVGIIGPMFERWSSTEFRTTRSMIYFFSGLAAIGPFIYFDLQHGMKQFPNSPENPVLSILTSMSIQFLIGMIVYETRIPERFGPGKFDFLGNSHQIWHIFVVTGTMTMYNGIVGLIMWKLDDKCPIQ
ncbi:hemolysin-III related-domain-containing protein [Globomyces pollinis-pini]|nr:hemolysin-III related-domain-containing protein [Globomyces pollinis-pini]